MGFINFFNDIVSRDEKEIYILKGGPGTGKSRLMKKISNAAVEDGYDVELIKCSSDPDSIDGVRIPELKKTVVDGTAPHIVDMKLPGGRDQIINLGDYWNEEELKAHSKDIFQLTEQKGENFKRAYNYLRAARAIRDNVDYVEDKALANGRLNIFTKNMCDKFFGDFDISFKIGHIRRMFGSAITSKGIINTLCTLFRNLKVYTFRCEYGRTSCYVVEELQAQAIKRGFYVESLRCPFEPERTEHIIIPQMSLAFTTYNKYHKEIECEIFGEYLLDAYHNDLISEPYLKDMEYDVFRIEELTEKAQRYLEKAQNVHKQVENFYMKNMDFDALNHCADNLIENILGRNI